MYFVLKWGRIVGLNVTTEGEVMPVPQMLFNRLSFTHMAQLNMYLGYYRRHYMRPDDNPPIGLLLCTEYGQEMVEYVVPNTDPHLFVAQYELLLPSKEKMKDFLMRENRG